MNICRANLLFIICPWIISEMEISVNLVVESSLSVESIRRNICKRMENLYVDYFTIIVIELIKFLDDT